MIEKGKFNAMKLLSRENPDSVDWLSEHGVGRIIVRLMLQGDALSTPASAWADTREKVRGFYLKGVRHFELHNEPNLNIEGLDRYWANGTSFAKWFSGLALLLKGELPDALARVYERGCLDGCVEVGGLDWVSLLLDNPWRYNKQGSRCSLDGVLGV